jgi:hypothetical protein
MNIGLLDVDGHNFPNLALMKLSAYHKNNGDNVEWFNLINEYDIVYKSKVFTFTPDYQYYIKSKQIIKGGTGYNFDTLFCEKVQPDYSLYPISKWYDQKTAYGFLTRGCPNKCKHCLVPQKEGKIKPYMDIEEISQGYKNVILLDNNILASDYGLNQTEKIIKLKLKVDFNQGLDARLINDEIAKLLSKVKWLKPLRMACDSLKMIKHVKRATELLRKHNCTPKNYFVYVLVDEYKDSLKRINFCKSLSLDPFAQPFRNFTNNQVIPQWQKNMSRWCNDKAIFNTIEFEKYKN